MSWHYAAGRKKDWKGREWYEVHEVYVRENEGGDFHSVDGIRAGGESVKELLDDLRMMIRDITHYGVVDVGEDE